MSLYIKFLGTPKVFIDRKEIFISQNKLRLLFLYIAYNEDCQRDELANLFWGDSSEEKAKGNLRNSLYELRKLLPEGILSIKGHDYVGINRAIQLEKDIDLFLDEDRDSKILELSDLNFMDKVNIGGYDDYGDWVESVRVAYNGIIIAALNANLDKAISLKNVEKIKTLSERIITLDPYNEKAYREIMKICIYNHSYIEGAKYYRVLKKKVNGDLGLELEQKTEEIYEILKSKEKYLVENEGTDEYERIDLIVQIQREYKQFLASKPFENIILSGEMGIGKSRIVERFLETVELEVIKLRFHPNDVLSPYKCVDELFYEYDINAGDYNTKMMDLAEKLARTKKVIYLDSLEYIDFESLKLISNHLIRRGLKNIFIVSEFNKSCIRDQRFLKYVKNIENLNFIDVYPLTEYQTIEYINTIVDDRGEVDYDDIFNRSHGNIMMIEYLLKGNEYAENIVEQIINSLTDEEYLLLKRLSVFKSKSEFSYISKLVQGNELSTLSLLDSLLAKELIVYKDGVFSIKYELIKEVAYEKINPAIAGELHKMIAEIIESEKEISYSILQELIYHYEMIGDGMNENRNRIKALEMRLDYQDQFFPIIEKIDILEQLGEFSKSQVYEEFEVLTENLNNLRKTIKHDEYYKLKMKLEYLMGRTMVLGGRSAEGILHIENLIEMAQSISSNKYLKLAYIEYIHYGIHNYDDNVMKKYIDKLKSIVVPEEEPLDYAELIRLEGLYETRVGNLDRAEELLIESLEIYHIRRFETISIIPMAASYNYLGNLYTEKRDYVKAEEYFLKAIHKCLDNGLTKSLDIFYADYGYMLYIKGSYAKAKNAMQSAISYFDILGTHWKRSKVESVSGIIAVGEGDLDGATLHMRNAEIFYKSDQTAEEKKLLDHLKNSIKEHKMTILN